MTQKNKDPSCYLCNKLISDNLVSQNKGIRNKYDIDSNGQKFICLIDMNDHDKDEEFMLSCKHSYCRSCLQNYLVHEMKNIRPYAAEITCRRCSEGVKNFEVLGLLNYEEYMKYMEITNNCIQIDNVVRYCQFCGIGFKEDELRDKICPNPRCLKSYSDAN